MLLSGFSFSYPSTYYAILVRISADGSLDGSFGSGGIYKLPGYAISATKVIGDTIWLGGLDNTNPANQNPFVAKMIPLHIDQDFIILGKEIVNKNDLEVYKLEPYNTTWYTQWRYVPNSITTDSVFLITTNAQLAYIYFPDKAPSGTLKCYIYPNPHASMPLDSAELSITINKNANSLASLLEELSCEVEPGICSNAYINYFEVRGTNIKTDNTGCKSGAYSDYTSTEYNDTLYLGEVYTITIQAGGSKKTGSFYGVWIDYNNDGAFDDENEFITASIVPDSIYKSDYLIIKNNSEYAGNPARLRVRMRTDKPFGQFEFCQKKSEEGETEDYFVFLKQREKIALPNFITPNNDGKNDVFVIRGIIPEEDNELKIYNRLGELVFNKSSYENNWQGTDNNGEMLRAGTYYYVFTNGKETEKGFFEIRR
jgi:gliding motility-associated-like protein